jgi:hypothetical protein
MWDDILNNLPDQITVICTILAFAIPYGTYKINQGLHKKGDPPWKKKETHTSEE